MKSSSSYYPIEHQWNLLSEELDATLILGTDGPDKLYKGHRGWVIRMHFEVDRTRGRYSTSTLRGGNTVRVQTPFISRDDFSFHIQPQTLLGTIGHFLGDRETKIGYRPIDDKFLIKTNSQSQLLRLFESTDLAALIFAQNDFSFGTQSESVLRDHISEKSKFLEYETFYTLSTMCEPYKLRKPLKQIFDLFEATLDQMTLIGSADWDASREIFENDEHDW